MKPYNCVQINDINTIEIITWNYRIICIILEYLKLHNSVEIICISPKYFCLGQ